MSFCINPLCPKPQNTDNHLFCFGCGSELLLQGRYRVTHQLGGGGFGKTFEVNDRDGSPKVLKVLINNHPKAIELFQREAQVLSRLHHPGIPQVEPDAYFIFSPRNNTTPLHCLVMEKIAGLDLQEYLQKRGRPIDQKLAIQWLAQLAKILREVHNQNFFHRDIKPPNIMLKTNGHLALIDFGTARAVTGTYVAKQAVGQVTGVISAGYTPPEQMHGQAVQQSDFFALGRTFIYLLTGKEPSKFYDVMTDELHWRNGAPNISPLLADFLDEMMARLPSVRPPNADAIWQRLLNIHSTLYPQPIRFQSPQAQTDPGVAPTQPVITSLSSQSFFKTTLTGHSDSVLSIAFSLDGQTLASGSRDKTIEIWNLSTGQLVHTLTGHSWWVWSVAFSLDGQTLASGSADKTIKIWNLSTGQLVRTLTGDSHPIASVAFSPDGQTLVSCSAEKTIKIWNLSTGQLVRTLMGHSNPVTSVAFSPDGQTLVSCSYDNEIEIWNLSTGQVIRTLTGHSGWINVAISPDGQTLVSGSRDKTIKIWNLSTGQVIRTLTGHSDWINSVAISPDGQTLASGSRDKTIKIWNLSTGQVIRTLTGHSDSVNSVAFSPDGQTLASGSDDETIKTWRVPN